MSKGLLVGLGVVGVIVVALLLVGGSYVSAKNQMVAKDQAVKSAWSEVDVQLQRRADLIPNLVETVKGFTKEEKSCMRRYRECSRRDVERADSAGEDCGQRTVGWGAGTVAAADGELSATAVERTVHAAAG